MAKRTKIDVVEYINELPGLDDDSKKLIADKLAASPDAVKRLQDGFMSSADYQSHMAELENERKAAAETKAAADKLRAENQEWYEKNVGSGALSQMEQELAAYRATYGTFNQSITPQQTQNQPQYLTKAELEAAIAKERAANQDWSAGMVAKALPLAIQHYKDFGEALDVNGLIQTAIQLGKEPSSPLDIAYSRMTADRRAAQAAEAEKAKLDQARKDWERDMRSRQGSVATDRPEDHSILYSAVRQEPEKVPASVQESNRLSSFKQIWNEVGDELAAKEAAHA